MTNRVLWEHGREEVDEIVVTNCTVHLERMADNSVWLGIDRGGDPMLHIDVTTRRAPIRTTIRAEDWVFDEEDEHA